ncbi:MAG: GTP-binding protein [Candidatus Helarchaeota archaeon]|nr:GTP-binding protein [Candidatus Helarchaeota archaeon]
MEHEYRFKVVVVGEEAVGKTSLILRYVENTFEGDYIPTLGVNFVVKDLPDMSTRLVIWDIGGQNMWKAKLNLYLKGSDGAIIIFDVTRPVTFGTLDTWISKLQQQLDPQFPYVVVGNKTDLQDLRKVQEAHAHKFLKNKRHSIYFEASAKTGKNVEDLFRRIADELIKLQQ